MKKIFALVLAGLMILACVACDGNNNETTAPVTDAPETDAPEVEAPVATYKFKPACGRVNNSEREADERKHDFALMEKPMTEEEAMQECSRCLRCDHYGCATLKGGRVNKW